MSRQQIEDALKETAEDWTLTRSERSDFKELLAQQSPSPQELAYLRHIAFKTAHSKLAHAEDKQLLNWLEDAIKTLLPAAPKSAASTAEAHFSPGEACRDRIRILLDSAQKTADICVFTITDNHIADAILRAHQRGVAVRIVTDNDKAEDRGSDVDQLERRGLPVRVDRTEHHMHHKFMVVDSRQLLTGSYNWTRSAFTSNQENVAVTTDERLVKPFLVEFERLWAKFE